MHTGSGNNRTSNLKQQIGLFAGPVVALALLAFFDLEPGSPVVTRTAAVAALMAIWWITEAIPIPATALLPVALFPLLGIMPGKSTAATYFNHIIFLFIGGFIMALAMQRWNLHRRIALSIILLIGASPKRLVLGFMAATAFLSMWISNTATTMMMVPIAMAIIIKLKESLEDSPAVRRFAVGLLIGIAYAASIGGTATLIGTPPNLSFSRIFNIYFPQGPEISFAQWFQFGIVFSVIFLIVAWLLLTFIFVPRRKRVVPEVSLFRQEYRRLGPMSYEEKIVLALFAVMALLWLSRQSITVGGFTIPGWSNIMPVPGFIDDGTIAITVAMILFLLPSRTQKGKRLMDWKTATRLHWGIVILFGGGFALASGFKESGLSVWVAGQLTGLGGIAPVFLIGSICTMLTFLTELTSNTATTEMILPLLGSLAVAIKTNPLLLMIPATLSASCAFMLPVATPPNAIVFGTGEVQMSDMMRVGIIMNFVGVILITTLVYLIGVVVFNIDTGVMPDWAVAG
ncbi:MAG: SLC13/DASS family transporter [Candidatus Zixiibacteriota bacterium]|nr:MAG: SLC13/DASS family transporter [candidate division Zixibacteria bacterium]